VLCLRLAIIMCHARNEVKTNAWRLSGKAPLMRLDYSRNWARRHPRTLFLLNEEVAVWARTQSLTLTLNASSSVSSVPSVP
jgi:exopolyphosphatase/guanosine-5'-triphosphate,3'-diphosphate pyrophosphatase